MPNLDPLSIDLYELWMAMTYRESRMRGQATFEFFIRGPAKGRNFFVAAGLETLLDFLESFELTADRLESLGRCGLDVARLKILQGLRFGGDVEAVPEGTIVFPDEPFAVIVAPIDQAQIVETAVINLLQFQTMIASKAVRSVIAAGGRRLFDFGLRRAHGTEAGLFAARACFIAGFESTSDVLAGVEFGIPLSGTMAHSFVQAHAGEEEAFLDFARHNPGNITLLIDTYDTIRGARHATATARRLRDEGIRVKAVRLDSGDLAALSKEVRMILDGAGLAEVKIVASGGLDEFSIRTLLAEGAPIDIFGVGTKIDVSADAPYLDCAYKIVEYDGQPRFKLSAGKVLLPGRKRVFRYFDERGQFSHDVVARADEPLEGKALLESVMRNGKRTGPRRSAHEIREFIRRGLTELPENFKKLEKSVDGVVRVSDGLQTLRQRLEPLTSS